MTRIYTAFLFIILLSQCQAYFEDKDHKELARSFIQEFITGFTSQFDAFSAEGLDHIGAMKLAFDYWITKLRIHNFEKFSIDFDVDHDIIEIDSPTLTLDLIIEDKYTIPVKLEDLHVSIILNTSREHFRCTDVEIDYKSLSLDLNMVVEYLSRQLLSLDGVKSAIKVAETPIRNVIIQAIRSNHERLFILLHQLKDGTLNPKELLNRLSDVHHSRIENREFIINVRSIFNYESLREKEKKSDL